MKEKDRNHLEALVLVIQDIIEIISSEKGLSFEGCNAHIQQILSKEKTVEEIAQILIENGIFWINFGAITIQRGIALGSKENQIHQFQVPDDKIRDKLKDRKNKRKLKFQVWFLSR